MPPSKKQLIDCELMTFHVETWSSHFLFVFTIAAGCYDKQHCSSDEPAPSKNCEMV